VAKGHDPAWSPNGRMIVFSDFGRLVTIRSDGRARRPIPGTRPLFPSGYPSRPPIAWSPNGRRIFYVSGDADRSAVYATNVDGTQRKNLTPSLKVVGTFAVSPGGGRIAVAARVAGGGRVAGEDRQDVYVLRSDGAGLRRLTRAPRTSSGDPQWSPDGKKIVYTQGVGKQSEIFAMNANGTQQTNLTRTRFNEFAPAWRPLP
jgi:TolB protein